MAVVQTARDRSLQAFLAISLLVALPALVAHVRMGRYALHLAMNGWHGPAGDTLFPLLTGLANGWFTVFLALVMLLFRNWRSFLMLALSTGLSGLLIQALKHFVFDDHGRPALYLEQMPGLQLVAGLDLHHHFSFPSGHSATAFSMALSLAVILGKRIPAVLLALFAALLAYSRVYLSQHFTEDILAGGAVGCVVATSVYAMLYRGSLAAEGRLDSSPMRGPRA